MISTSLLSREYRNSERMSSLQPWGIFLILRSIKHLVVGTVEASKKSSVLSCALACYHNSQTFIEQIQRFICDTLIA